MGTAASGLKVGGLDGQSRDGEHLIGNSDPRFSGSLERGLAILECFDSEDFDGGEWLLGIAEIAARLGMSRSTAHRYVITLQELGFLKQGAGRRYGPTLAVTKLGCSAMSRMSLALQAGPSMSELAQRTGFAVELGVLDGPEVLLVERIDFRRRQLVRGASDGKMRQPAYCTALGKVLLAMLPEAVARKTIRGLALTRQLPNTIRSKRLLLEELSQIQEDCLALCNEELVAGRVMIAAAVRDESGEARAALGLSAAKSRITAEGLRYELGSHLQSTADQVSARLGYRRAHERARAL